MIADVTYTIEISPEDMPIEGNASAIDEATDREVAEWIRAQLRAGNEWAWCVVRVVATVEVEGETFTGDSYLSGCSYKNEEDFKAGGGYFNDLQVDALEDLQRVIAEAKHRGEIAGKVVLR